jgi:hypothetical protein
MFARSLARHPEARHRAITTVAFDPGQVFGTGLARDLPLHMRLAWRAMGNPIASWPVRHWKETLNTQTDAADALARLALGELAAPEGANYAALRRGRVKWTEPSQLACDELACEEFWATSARLAGLGPARFGAAEQFAVAGIGG